MSEELARRRRRGIRAERELVQLLWKHGFACIRGPASGSRIKRSVYPDVVAIRSGNVLAFEVKTRSDEAPFYVESRQVEKLKEFVRRAGGRAYIALKVKGKGWRFIPIELLEPTPGGRYKVGEAALSSAITLAELIRRATTAGPIDSYLSEPA